MNELLNSLKSDLTNRRLVPFVALAVIALLGAVAYVVVGAGSSSPSTPTAAIPGSSAGLAATGGLAISQSTPNKSVAETTDGGSAQRQGVAHNPFAKLPPSAKEKAAAAAAAAAAKKASAAGASKGASSGSGSESGTSSKSGESTKPTPAQPANPTKPSKPQTVYHVAVLFGIAPATATPPGTPLTPYAKLKLQTPLPSAGQPLVVFRGVTSGGKSATFTIVGETILHGNASCLPSASQCQAIDLKAGQSEQLEVLESGLTLTYELRVVSITSSKASASSVKNLLLHGVSKAGSELLRHAGLVSIPYLSYSSQPGVLVFAPRMASTARAHAAIRGHRGR